MENGNRQTPEFRREAVRREIAQDPGIGRSTPSHWLSPPALTRVLAAHCQAHPGRAANADQPTASLRLESTPDSWRAWSRSCANRRGLRSPRLASMPTRPRLPIN